MNMQDCIRLLMSLGHVTQRQFARWRGVSINTISVLLNQKDMRCSVAADLLDFMGYEIIVREIGTVRRADEIKIDSAEDIDFDKLRELKRAKEERDAVERYYSVKDREIRELYPDGMRAKDLCEYFHRNNPLIRQYFDGFFFNKRVPLNEVSRIMREYRL